MLPREKARELGNKFYECDVFDYDKQRHLDEIEKAKKRATICVQEILKTILIKEPCCKDWSYWNHVLSEISKL